MKLLKFNLVFIPILALSLGAIGYIAQKMLLEDARQHVIENARIIMETALSSRTYTTKQVAPLLEQKNFKLQTAVAEFRKTLESMPKTFDPNATADVRASLKKGFTLGQQRALEALEQFVASAKDKPGELRLTREIVSADEETAWNLQAVDAPYARTKRQAERYDVPAHQLLHRAGQRKLIGGQEDQLIDIALEIKREQASGQQAVPH